MNKTFYITTPIYYVNGVPHVGSATTTLICDAITRYHRMLGEAVFFLTGTDEHAQKVAEAAARAGKPTQEFVDEISQRFVATWKLLGIEYDRFIRTTEPDHKKAVAEVFRRLQATGDIYKGKYEGWYSVADETFFRDSDVENGRAKETGAAVERVTEENYYFRLSAYARKLLERIESNPDFLMPETRKNEVIAFINEGLRDVPVSRRNTGWGIPVPGDESQVVYVWFDALINYIAACGWPDNASGKPMWPADAHLVGKEIYTRFHATLWPAMLIGLDLPLPKHVIGHGWWLVRTGNELEKASKSKGNIPTPEEVIDWLVASSGIAPEYGVDALRYYLLRDISFTGDAEFSYENLIARYNGDLANNLGNLLNRSINMLRQYNDGIVPAVASAEATSDFSGAAQSAAAEVTAGLNGYNPGASIETIMRFCAACNKALDTAAPWKKHKSGDRAAVDLALYGALESLRIVSVMLSPFIPAAALEIRRQLGLGDQPASTWREASAWGLLPAGTKVGEALPIFPRIDLKKQAATVAAPANADSPSAASQPVAAAHPDAGAGSGLISIDDFAKVSLRIAEIVTAERVEGAKKLLKLMVDAGEGQPRQLVAGIAEFYAPEDLPGRKIVIVANLQPATIRGVQSNGMLLAATGPDGRAILLTPDDVAIPAGSKIK